MVKKTYAVQAHLEHVVNLKDGSLHGYWVLTRIVSGGIEIGFNASCKL